MKLLTQRGDDQFLVEDDGKTYLINTADKTINTIEDPNIIYKLGYCEDPDPSVEQFEILSEIIKNKPND